MSNLCVIVQEEKARSVAARPRFQPVHNLDTLDFSWMVTFGLQKQGCWYKFASAETVHGCTATQVMEIDNPRRGRPGPAMLPVLSFGFAGME